MTHAKPPSLLRPPSRRSGPGRRRAGVAAVFGLCALSPVTAEASAVFAARAYADLFAYAATYEIGGGDASADLSATLDDSDVFEDPFEGGQGAASVFAQGIDLSDTGDGWFVNGEADGDSGPVEGFAYGHANAYFDYIVTNLSDDAAILLNFTYDLGVSVDSLIDVDAANVFYDAAVYASALFYVDSVPVCGCTVEPTDPDGIHDLLEFDSDTLLGPFGADGDERLGRSFSYLLAPGATVYVTLESYVEGFAVAIPTPLPAALPMMAAGLAGLGLLARRRRRAA